MGKNLFIHQIFYGSQVPNFFLKSSRWISSSTSLSQRSLRSTLFCSSACFITSSDIFCTLIDSRNSEVVFSVLENEITFFEKSQEVTIRPFTNTDKLYSGSISEINPLVDENGLIQVKVKINSKETNFFDGIYVKVTASKPIENVVVVPKEALVLRSNREVVFTYENGLAVSFPKNRTV